MTLAHRYAVRRERPGAIAQPSARGPGPTPDRPRPVVEALDDVHPRAVPHPRDAFALGIYPWSDVPANRPVAARVPPTRWAADRAGRRAPRGA